MTAPLRASAGSGTAGEAGRRVVVLVDAYSTGAMLARLAAADHRVVHVRSRSGMPAAFAASAPQDAFERELDYPGHEDEVLRALTALRPIAVIPASEFGIEVADELAERLGVRGNHPSLSLARRDKACMMQVLARAGLRTPRQLRSARVEDLLSWRHAHGLGRVVVKPLTSAGSDDVYICESDAEVVDAFRSIYGKRNLMMRVNQAVLVQEYLDGQEFVVNSVSCGGRHWFTDAWLSVKVTQDRQRKIYDYEDLLAPSDPALERILPYVGEALTALGVGVGPAHTELMLTPEGPCLLETAARVSGLANPEALDRCTGANQVGLTLDCYIGDAAVLRERPLRYPRHELSRCVNLVARREVPMPAQRFRDEVERMPAFESIRFRVEEGQPTQRTVDLNSSPAVVFLVHHDPAEIESAYARLRALAEELL